MIIRWISVATTTVGLSTSPAILAAIDHQEFSVQQLKKVEIRNLSGNVSLRESKDQKVRVQVDKQQFGPNCNIEMGARGKTFGLKVDKSKSSTDSCQVHLTVEVPKDLDVDIKNGAGKLSMAVAAKEVEVSVGAGEIQVGAPVKELEVKLGAGNVTAKQLLEEGKFKLGTGNLAVDFAPTARKGDFDAKVGAGNIALRLPQGASAETRFKSAFGQMTTEFPTKKESTFSVDVKVGTGNLAVKKLP